MTTVLFLLTAVLVAYIVYMLVTSTGTTVPSYERVKKSKPKPKPSASKPAATATAATTATASNDAAKNEVSTLKNPKTGETATNPTNYRFAKRWIKEALVAEGLLDRLYKNNELSDSKISKQVKQALDRFKEIEKYHGE